MSRFDCRNDTFGLCQVFKCIYRLIICDGNILGSANIVKMRVFGADAWIDLHEGLSALGSVDSEDYTEILFDYATFSGDVVAVENGRYGIEVVSVINATTSNLNTGDGTTLETYYLYSVLEYEDGGWKVGDERLS